MIALLLILWARVWFTVPQATTPPERLCDGRREDAACAVTRIRAWVLQPSGLFAHAWSLNFKPWQDGKRKSLYFNDALVPRGAKRVVRLAVGDSVKFSCRDSELEVIGK